MRRRIARKILKRTGHHVRFLAMNCEAHDYKNKFGYKHSTIDRAVTLASPKVDLTPGTWEHPKKWGLLDRDTETWLGKGDCPLTYDNYDVTRIAARMLAAQLEWSPLRIQVIPFTTATRKLDDLEVTYTFDEAWDRVMTGKVL